jgi:hypothetical protein
MSVNQNQDFQYYDHAKPLFELTSVCQVIVHTKRLLYSPVINHIDEETLQKVLKIKYTYKNKDKYAPFTMKLWNLYQTIKNGYTFDEDTSYNHILTSIREKYAPKTDKHLKDEFCKVYEEQHNNKDLDYNFEEQLEEFQDGYDVLELMGLLYCWFKMNKSNDKDWVGIPDCIKDIDENELTCMPW